MASDDPTPPDDESATNKSVSLVGAGIKTRHEARMEEGLEEADWAKKPTMPGFGWVGPITDRLAD